MSARAQAHIHVNVHLHADLARYAPDGRGGVFTLELPTGATCADALARAGVPSERRVLVGLNGDTATPEHLLTDGARLDVVTPIAGGTGQE